MIKKSNQKFISAFEAAKCCKFRLENSFVSKNPSSASDAIHLVFSLSSRVVFVTVVLLK